jgi:hypothetical protein
MKIFFWGDYPGAHNREARAAVHWLRRSGFKTPSKARWLRCAPLQNAHILSCMLRFIIGSRLALEPDLRF